MERYKIIEIPIEMAHVHVCTHRYCKHVSLFWSHLDSFSFIINVDTCGLCTDICGIQK